MRQFWISGLMTMACVSGLLAQTNEMDTTSYGIGVIIAKSLQQQGITELNTKELAQAFEDVLSGGDVMIDDQRAMQAYKEAVEKGKKEQFATVMEKGADFLKENGQRDEVTVLPSGLQYEVLEAGDGPKPSATDQVKVHYEGKLLNGQIFDSSYQRGEPITFCLNQVIAGWTEGLQQMSVGSKYKLYIPYHLAYGEQGAGGSIGPYETLVFTVELLGIE